MSGKSEQEYDAQDPVSNPDTEQQTVIQVRLVEKEMSKGPRQLIASNSTPYPPPLPVGRGGRTVTTRKLNLDSD